MDDRPHRPKISSASFNEEVLDRLLFGAKEIDCPKMELARASVAKPCVFAGPGYIRRDEDGPLLFKIYPADLPDGFKFQDEWTGSSAAGRLIEKSRYYTLTATDYVGQTWSSDFILPGFTTGPSGVMVHGNVRELRSEKTMTYSYDSRFFRLLFLEDTDIPCNAATQTTVARAGEENAFPSISLNLATFSSCGFDFVLQREAGELVVEVKSGNDMPPQLESRVIESLEFVLARSLHCRISEKVVGSSSTIRVTAARKMSPHTTTPPPLHLNAVQAHSPLNCVWEMFDRYLNFILPHDRPDRHPCSIFIYKAREASANSPDARALGVTVAVEGMVNALHYSIGQPSPELKEAISVLKSFVKTWPGIPEWEGETSLRARLPGLINQLTSVRAVDRLYGLAQQGCVDTRLIDAWKSLRNPMAHAELPDPTARQAFYDKILAATVLLNQLVFAAIGYSGFYSDYSIHGFPTKKYPPESKS